ncbi:MAG: LptA/OstA family protein [candidate division WOR-3 bacterium]
MFWMLLLMIAYKIESGEMQIVRESGKETILFYGGVVITDTNLVLTSPSAIYVEKEGIMELSGPVSGVSGSRSLRCERATILEKSRIFKGYGSCHVEGPGEKLVCDSIILHGDSILAFGNVFVWSEKDSIEAKGSVILLKENFIRSLGNGYLGSTGKDSISLYSDCYIYQDSVLSASKNVALFSPDFEARGDSLYYDRRVRILTFSGNAQAKNEANTIMGDTILSFLNLDNKIDSTVAFPRARLLNRENEKEIFLEADTIKFYTEGRDSLRYFRAYNVKGYYREGGE